MRNDTLVARLEEANARADQVTPLEARIRELEQELARATGERDAQRAAADQKVQEAEAREAELRQARAALEQKEQALEAKEAELQCKETELQRERAIVATLTGTLEEKGKALEEKVVALQDAEAALKEKEDSLSTLEEAARVQQEEAQGAIAGKYLGFCCCSILFYHNLSWFPCSELKKAVANETAAKEAVNTALTAAHDEYAELKRTAVSVCQELEGAGALSGSSVASHMRVLGGRITEHAKSTFRLGVL